MATPITTRESVLGELERVLSSPVFEPAGRSRALLKFVVEETLNGRSDRLKEYTVGSEALDKGESFDPRSDPIVRAEVSRLRSRLERYYATDGLTDAVIITLPKGGYVPRFIERGAPEARLQPAGLRNAQWTHRIPRIAAVVTLAACAFAAGVILPWRPTKKPQRRVTELNVKLTSQGVLGGEVGPSIALSQDGTRIAFIVSGPDGVPHLHFRLLDQSNDRELPGTEGVRGPFFSPDGSWIGFWAAGKLKKTNIDGGSPVVLCDAPDLQGAGWGEDGQIVAAFGSPKLFRIPSAGGVPTEILDLSQQTQIPAWPQTLRDGKTVLYTAGGSSGPNQSSIESLSLETGKRTVLIAGGTFGRAFDSYLTYINQGTLYAVRFDAEKAQVHGSPVPVLDGVSYSATFGYADADFSRTGDLVFRKHQRSDVIAQWIDGSGRGAPIVSKPGTYLWPRLSPDRKRLSISVTESGEPAVYIYETGSDRFAPIQLSSGPCLSVWAPNGRFLVMGCRGTLAWVRADGTGKPQPLLEGNTIRVPWSFSPDGSRLAYYELGPSTGLDLWTVPVHVTANGLTAGTPEVFLQTRAFEVCPTFSPDGRWIAYGSNESGTWEVYVRAFPDNGTAVRVSNAGGRIPFFSPSGTELFYRTDSQRIMVATYSVKHGVFIVHSVKQWSPVRLADTGVIANLDLDGQKDRFVGLMTAPGTNDDDADHHVTLILNFAERMRTRLSSSGR